MLKSRFMGYGPLQHPPRRFAIGRAGRLHTRKFPSGHLIDQLLTEAFDSEELLRQPVERAVGAGLANGLVYDALQIGGALLEWYADIADLEWLAGKGRLTREFLEIVARGEIGRDNDVDAPGEVLEALYAVYAFAHQRDHGRPRVGHRLVEHLLALVGDVHI